MRMNLDASLKTPTPQTEAPERYPLRKRPTRTRDNLSISEIVKEERIREKINEALQKHLKESGILSVSGERLTLDAEALKDIELYQDQKATLIAFMDGEQYRISKKHLVNYLKELEVVPQGASDVRDLDPRPVFGTASSRDDLLHQRLKPGLLEEWDILGTTNWEGKITLENGESATLLELFLSEQIAKYNISRDDGVLMMDDPHTAQRIPFNPQNFVQATGQYINIHSNVEDRVIFMRDAGITFMRQAFKSFFDSGFFKNSDFARQSKAVKEIYGSQEKHLVDNGRAKQFMFSNELGPAKYYFGRNNLPGTDIEFKDRDIRIRQLDSGTLGIMEVVHNKERVLYSLPMASNAAYEKLRETKRQHLLEKNGVMPSETQLQQFLTLGGNYTRDNLKEYKLTDIITRNPSETEEAYSERLAQLNDVSFVTGQVRNMFADVGVGILSLPWEEQLRIANAILEVKDTQVLVDFAKKHKLDGLRTFLSLEQGGEAMAGKILLLGEKLEQQHTDVLFRTYGEMTNATDTVESILVEALGEAATPELIAQSREKLLFRGKNLLERYAIDAETCEGSSCQELGEQLAQKLELAKSSVYAFSVACRALVDRGEFTFEDFQAVQLAYDKSPLPEKMQEQIRSMHAINTEQYPEKLRDYWRKTLHESLEKGNEKQMIVSAKYNDDIAAVMRIIEQADGSWYGASFNVNPTVQGSRIGTELLKQVLKDLAKDKPFVADCYEGNPMLDTYINKFGFKITDTIENYENTGATVYKITLYPGDQ